MARRSAVIAFGGYWPYARSMTPRQREVAFVLEAVGGVRAVYRIDAARPAGAHFDFAVEMEPGGRVLAAVHYALLRVLTHDECARVFLFVDQPPNVIAESAEHLQLTEAEREEARRRVPPLPPPFIEGGVVDSLPVRSDPTVLIAARRVLTRGDVRATPRAG